MAQVNIDAIDAFVGGRELKLGAQLIDLADSDTGYNLAGAYTISLQKVISGSSVTAKYVVTYGITPSESPTQINICRAVLTPTGLVFLRDCRNLSVDMESVNKIVKQGGGLADGIVHFVNLATDVVELLQTAIVSTTAPPTPFDGTLWYDPTTSVFSIWVAGSPGSWEVISGVFPSIADGDLLANISGSTASPIGETLSDYLDYVLGTSSSEQGTLLMRGASNWKKLGPGSSGQVLKANGVADLSWEDGAFVDLQASTPGTPQTGDSNVSGTATAGTLQTGGGSGPTWTSGTGAPSGTPTIGSLYSRTDAPDAGEALYAYVPSAGFHALQISDGAEHCYRLDETSGTTAVDSGIGTPADGTYSGSYTLGASPLVSDQAGNAEFSGGKVTLPFDDPPVDANGSFSIELIGKLASSAANYWAAITNGSDPGNSHDGFGEVWDVPDGHIAAAVANGSGEAFSLVAGTPTSGTRYHVVVVYDGLTGAVVIYVNNVAGVAAGSGGYSSSGHPFTIAAASFDGILSSFVGSIAAVAFYAGKLTSTQVGNHYAAIDAAAWIPVSIP